MTTLFGTIDYKEVSEISETPRRKLGWLPLLTVLFMISYGLMTMLIVEQGATIESQRALIRELFHDSTELSAIKKAAQESAQPSSAQTQAQETQTLPTQTPSTQVPLARTPSTQTPSTQAQASQTPSSQAGPQQRAQNQSAKQKAFRMPSKPEPDLVDDVRTLIVI